VEHPGEAAKSRRAWQSQPIGGYMYLDPGSGSLILQVLIASILATPFLLRSQIRRLVRTMRGPERPPESPNENES